MESDRSSWLWVVGAAMIAAAAIGAGTLHEQQHADSLLMVLISLQRWTPFFWGQDRLGTLVPLLAMPIRDPFLNLLVQDWLTTAAALIAPFVVSRCLLDTKDRWMTAGVLANLLLLLTASRELRFDWFVTQPYGLAIALGCAGLLVLDSSGIRPWLLGLALLTLASWIHVGMVALLAPLIVVRRRRVAAALGAAVAAAVVGMLLQRLADHHITMTLASLASCPHAWWQLGVNAVANVAHPMAALIACGALVVTLAVFPQRSALAAAGSSVAVAAVYWAAIGASEWARLNAYYPRYVYPSLLLLGVAAAIVLTTPLIGHARRSTAVALSGLIIVAAVSYGPPSIQRVRASLDARFGRMTSDVLASNATVVAGDYWTVWPAVFHANIARYRTAGRVDVYGLRIGRKRPIPLWNGGSGEGADCSGSRGPRHRPVRPTHQRRHPLPQGNADAPPVRGPPCAGSPCRLPSSMISAAAKRAIRSSCCPPIR